MVGRGSRFSILHVTVALVLVSAGCAASVTAPNDAAVTVENEDDVSHTVQIQISVENRTVVSRTARVQSGNERTLNQSTVPVTGTDRRYRVRIRLGNGRTNATTFVEGEFDSVQIVVGRDGAIRIAWVDAT